MVQHVGSPGREAAEVVPEAFEECGVEEIAGLDETLLDPGVVRGQIASAVVPSEGLAPGVARAQSQDCLLYTSRCV